MYIEFKQILYYIYRPSGKNQFQGGGNKYKSDNFTETVSVLSYSSNPLQIKKKKENRFEKLNRLELCQI